MRLLRLFGMWIGLAALATGCKYMEQSSQSSAAGLTPLAPPGTLDYGIYWFGPGSASEKAVKGKPNRFFDPGKPTLLYTHGWERGSQARRSSRRGFLFYQDGTADERSQLYTADPWIRRGWNIGQFFWDQMSDENLVVHAENKIWSPKTPVGMRWRDEKGVFHNEGMPEVSVAELIYQNYLDVMSEYKGDHIRIVGHSLGSQLAVLLSGRLYYEAQQNPDLKKLVPKRVALLDPFFMRANDAVAWPGEVIRFMVNETKETIAWEMIKTSGVLDVPIVGPLFADRNDELTKAIGETVFKPEFKDVKDNAMQTLVNRHNAAIGIYLMSIETSAPSCCAGKDCAPPVLAAASDASVRSFMSMGKSCVQKEKMKSFKDIAVVPLGLNDLPFVDPTDDTAKSPEADTESREKVSDGSDDSDKTRGNTEGRSNRSIR